MECRIYNTSLTNIAVIQSWISLDWYEEYNGVGSFTLELDAQTNIYKDIQLDYYCGIADSETLMIIKSIIAQKNKVIISGYAAVFLLDSRISTSDITGSTSTAEILMRGLITNMTAYPCVQNAASAAGITDTYNGTLDKGSVLDRILAIAEDTEIGFKLKHDKTNKKLLFTCYKPTTASARYFTEYGNISNPEYMTGNNDHKNVATVEGADATVTVGETLTTGTSRKEIYIDATSEEKGDLTTSEYQDLLKGIGYAELAKHNREEALNFDINDTAAVLGSIAECKISEYGITATVRIIAVEVVSQNNRVERRIKLGTPIIRR